MKSSCVHSDRHLVEHIKNKYLLLPIKDPSEMSYREFKKAWDDLFEFARISERWGCLDPDHPYSYRAISNKEMKWLLDGDWEKFSLQRGYTTDDVVILRQWYKLSGQTDCLVDARSDPWRLLPSKQNFEPRRIWMFHRRRAGKSVVSE